jgi:outer membrane protein OmpA-like peptidoglycan-associated protein
LVGLGSATLINSNTTSAGVGTSFSANSGGTTVTVTYIADALPAGTVIDAYLLPNTTRAAGLIPDATNLLLSLIVAWKATDGTVPSVSAGNPITVTIVNAGIKAGAKIYILIGDAVTLLGTATVDGTASVSFTDDPEIVIANPAVTPPSSGGGGSSGGSAPTPAPTPAPVPAPTPAPTETPATTPAPTPTENLKPVVEALETTTVTAPVLVNQPTLTKTLKVFFEMGKSTLTKTQLKSVKAFAAGVDKKKLIKITIKGYVQKTFRQINDEKLPQLRAKSVAMALKKYGLTKKPMLSSGGYAVEKDDRARRVEVVITISR